MANLLLPLRWWMSFSLLSICFYCNCSIIFYVLCCSPAEGMWRHYDCVTLVAILKSLSELPLLMRVIFPPPQLSDKKSLLLLFFVKTRTGLGLIIFFWGGVVFCCVSGGLFLHTLCENVFISLVIIGFNLWRKKENKGTSWKEIRPNKM